LLGSLEVDGRRSSAGQPCTGNVFQMDLGGGYNCDSTSIRRPFDGHSIAHRGQLKSQWRNSLAVVTLTYLFI